jgi:hypothetical protein
MRERRLYDMLFFVEYFYSEDKELLRKLEEELRFSQREAGFFFDDS